MPPKSEGTPVTSGSHSHSRVSPVDTAVLEEVLERLEGRQRASQRYDDEKEIARGGMGSIHRVWDQDLRRHLAMKVVLERTTTDGSVEPGQERMLGRFIEEAQVTGQLDHPGIVPVHELGIDERGRTYFTMQLVRGRDLEALFKVVHSGADDEWTQTRALNVLLRVSDAMAYAHAKGVIHRDLKPANVMSGRFGEVYVMDWGLARVLGKDDPHDLRMSAGSDSGLSVEIHTARQDMREAVHDSPLVTLDGDVLGTPAYMSPEQARGDLDHMGPASDIYSLGAMLYHLLAGIMPYAQPGKRLPAVATWGLLQAGPPPALHEQNPEAPAELVAICEKAMARAPEDRYSDMTAFGRDLRAFLEGRVVGAFETGAVAEFKKWVRRNQALASTGIAAVLLIVTGLTIASVVLANKNDELQLSEQLALDRERDATQSARLAEERADTILRLADGKRLEQLRERAEAMWPALPDMVPAYAEWLREAKELSGRVAAHREELERLRQDSLAGFASTEEEWHHDTLAELVANLERLGAEDGLRADISARHEQARTITERSISNPDARARWARAIESIASAQASPTYGGLALTPQLGLLPLRRDARSDLWEFVDLMTGIEPERDPATQELLLTGETGVVFVLIPGGTGLMGSQAQDVGAPHFVQAHLSHENPLHEVTLAPFFLSKYELTQGQWLRFTGDNPSYYNPTSNLEGHQHDLVHPVERVTWNDCTLELGHLGLELPTEAQWEYAARAGSTTAWAPGDEREYLEGYANLADQAAERAGAVWPEVGDWPELDDGWAASARAGSFEPNAFGLFDMHGNVWEWCADSYEESYLTPERPGDGLREGAVGTTRVNRGGSYKHTAEKARSSYRNQSAADLVADVMGLRPARALQP